MSRTVVDLDDDLLADVAQALGTSTKKECARRCRRAGRAAGAASVVSGVSEAGAGVVLFGTEPLFRNHPKGSFAQVARALQWSTAVTGADVPAAG